MQDSNSNTERIEYGGVILLSFNLEWATHGEKLDEHECIHALKSKKCYILSTRKLSIPMLVSISNTERIECG